ncbi:DNA polymerase III subunit beta [Psychrobacillus sp. FSL H8-0510]|uniref:DNA polymerase III subunit beta n=1 Tax=Psychrobacillus sp. FSL H8-0510 TaxID=2921394 RepID=UPI0030F708E7
MKFTLPKAIITEVIGKIGRLMTAKSSIPILAGVLVEVQSKGVLFTVSDGTESMIHHVPVGDGSGIIVEDEGKSVFSKETFELCKKLKGDITFSVTETSVTVTQNKTSLEFATMAADEYPKIEITNTSKAIRFEGEDFEKIVKKTRYAASTSDDRPILQGVHMNLGETNSFICTDSHRLAKVLNGSSTEEIQITVPANVLEHAVKSFDLSNPVLIFPSSNQVSFANGTTILLSRLLEGNYPDTNRLIPTEYESDLVLNRLELIEALEMLALLGINGVVKLTVSGLFVELSAIGTGSKGKRELVFESWNGEEGFSISLSATYLVDALKTFSTNSVKIGFTGSMRPLVVTSGTEQETVDELQLILPVRSQ